MFNLIWEGINWKEGVLVTTRRGGERDLRWEGVYNPDLLLLCSCEINIAVCHKKKAQVNGGLVLLRHKKKRSNCGDLRLHKAGTQAIQVSTTDVEGTEQNPQRQGY